LASSYIEEAISTYLLADSNITNIVSTRIYYLEVPQVPTYPYIRFQIIFDPDLNFYVGTDGSNPRIQVDCVADNIDMVTLKLLDKNVRTRLNDYSGTMDGIVVNWIERSGANEFRDEEQIRITRDFIVNYERP